MYHMRQHNQHLLVLYFFVVIQAPLRAPPASYTASGLCLISASGQPQFRKRFSVLFPRDVDSQIRFLIKINLIGGTWLSIKFQCYDINLVWLQHNLVIDVFFFYFRWKRSGFISDQEGNISCKNSNSPRFTQLTSQTRGLNSEKLDICKEEQASCEWTEYDDFPSSENLSAFPADMEMDALNKTTEQSQPIINSKKSSRPKPCVN